LTRKNCLPKFPDDYIDTKADEYESSKWMERNQKRSTLLSIQYLFDNKLNDKEETIVQKNDSILILDLGCGTGFSSEILIQHGFRVIGVDILFDMISRAREKKGIYENYKDIELILANYGEKVKLLNDTAKYIKQILKQQGRVIIEFFPKDDKELNIFNKSFINNGFEGFMIKNNPKQKSGQTFLLLKKKE